MIRAYPMFFLGKAIDDHRFLRFHFMAALADVSAMDESVA